MAKHYMHWGQGILFPNSKRKSDKSPDYNGHICLDGREFYISGFKKKSKQGTTFMALSLGNPYYPNGDIPDMGNGGGNEDATF